MRVDLTGLIEAGKSSSSTSNSSCRKDPDNRSIYKIGFDNEPLVFH